MSQDAFLGRSTWPIRLQMIVVAVCATAMVIATDAEDYCGETTAKCIVAIGKD